MILIDGKKTADDIKLEIAEEVKRRIEETIKKISELESASSLNNGDLIELASVNALSETGYSSKKTTIEDVADKVATFEIKGGKSLKCIPQKRTYTLCFS